MTQCAIGALFRCTTRVSAASIRTGISSAGWRSRNWIRFVHIQRFCELPQSLLVGAVTDQADQEATVARQQRRGPDHCIEALNDADVPGKEADELVSPSVGLSDALSCLGIDLGSLGFVDPVRH